MAARGAESTYAFRDEVAAGGSKEYRVVELTDDGAAGSATPWFAVEVERSGGGRARGRR
jgi:hypothetical protein